MVDPPATPHRERWLHVVRDGEPGPEPGPAPPDRPVEPAGESLPAAGVEEGRVDPPPARPGAARLPGIFSRTPITQAPDRATGTAPVDTSAAEMAAKRPGGPTVPDPRRPVVPSPQPLAPHQDRAHQPAAARRAEYRPAEYRSGAYRSAEYRSAEGGPGLYRPGLYRPGLYRPGLYRPGLYRPGLYRPGLYRPGSYRPGEERPADGPAGEVEGAGGRCAIVRPRAPARWGRRVAWVWAGVTVGTAVAGILDRLIGGLDGRPALFLLVLLALPFWDGLPDRVAVRLAELAVVVAAVAVAWLAVAAIRPEGWWRAEIAYGLACGIAGTAHAVLPRRRTVER